MLPRPLKCDQNWLEMSDVTGGRICHRCSKKVVDFSKMNWSEIKEFQNLNQNRVCGMYNPVQLEHWGNQIPNNQHDWLKKLALSGMFYSVVTSGFTQTKINNEPTKIYGQVFDQQTGEILIGATIRLYENENEINGVVSDVKGNFYVESTKGSEQKMNSKLKVSYTGYKINEILLDEINIDSTSLQNHYLNDGVIKIGMNRDESIDNIIYFSVQKPSRLDRIKWKLKRFFK